MRKTNDDDDDNSNDDDDDDDDDNGAVVDDDEKGRARGDDDDEEDAQVLTSVSREARASALTPASCSCGTGVSKKSVPLAASTTAISSLCWPEPMSRAQRVASIVEQQALVRVWDVCLGTASARCGFRLLAG